MKTKIIVCIIVTLLCTTVIPILGMANESKNTTFDIAMNRDYCISSSGIGKSNDVSKFNSGRSIITVNNNDGDFLDQHQNWTSSAGWSIFNNQWLAQSFTPTLNILTRVQLYMFKGGNPPADAEVVFSIKASLQGVDLTSMILKSDKLAKNTAQVWIEFNFDDIKVTPNSLYYLVCKCTTGDANNSYCWVFSLNNSYGKGDLWFSLNKGQRWSEFNVYDCCFKTYGYNNNPPNTPTITGTT